MKALKSEFQYTTEQAKLYGDTTDILQEKATVLHKAIDAQKAKLEKLRGEYDKSKEQTGENSVQTQKLAEQVNIAAGELTSYGATTKRDAKRAWTAAEGTKNLKQVTEDMSQKIESASKTVGKIGPNYKKYYGTIEQRSDRMRQTCNGL